MRTIGTRWPQHPRYDYTSRCDVCGAAWPRSKLTRSDDGLYLCPYDRGQTVGELERANAMAAQRGKVQLRTDRVRGGNDLPRAVGGLAAGERLRLDLTLCALLTEAGEPILTEDGETICGPVP
jgi:hypothetical protein